MNSLLSKCKSFDVKKNSILQVNTQTFLFEELHFVSNIFHKIAQSFAVIKELLQISVITMLH